MPWASGGPSRDDEPASRPCGLRAKSGLQEEMSNKLLRGEEKVALQDIVKIPQQLQHQLGHAFGVEPWGVTILDGMPAYDPRLV